MKYHSSNWNTDKDDAVEEVGFIIRTWEIHFFISKMSKNAKIWCNFTSLSSVSNSFAILFPSSFLVIKHIYVVSLDCFLQQIHCSNLPGTPSKATGELGSQWGAVYNTSRQLCQFWVWWVPLPSLEVAHFYQFRVLRRYVCLLKGRGPRGNW